MNYRSVKTKKLNGLLKVLIVFTIIFLILTIALPAAASDLDEFEKAATTEKTEPKSDDNDDQDEKDKEHDVSLSLGEDDDNDSFWGSIFGGFIEAIIEAFFSGDRINMSLARVDQEARADAGEVEIRRTGEPTLPFFQYEHKYIRINSDIDARENGLELGYGPYGFSCRHTKFSEENPRDELSLIQYHLLLRISKRSSWEYGIGAGSLVMRGNEDNSGFSLTFPVKIYPSDSLGIRFKPTFSWINGNSIDEYDISLAYTRRYVSIQLGYRFLEANNKDLNGTYLGFAAHY